MCAFYDCLSLVLFRIGSFSDESCRISRPDFVVGYVFCYYRTSPDNSSPADGYGLADNRMSTYKCIFFDMYGNIFIVGFRGQDKVRQNECSGGNDHSLFNKDLFWIQRIKTYIFAYECVTRGFDFYPTPFAQEKSDPY